MSDTRIYKSREDFCEDAMRALSEKGYRTVLEFACSAHVAKTTATLLANRTYPGVRGKTGKWEFGRIASTTRICDILGLDLEAALVACGLPWVEHIIASARLGSKALILNRSDLEMLLQQEELIGPVPYTLVPQLVNMFRQKR